MDSRMDDGLSDGSGLIFGDVSIGHDKTPLTPVTVLRPRTEVQRELCQMGDAG